jgi:hypothetical protein
MFRTVFPWSLLFVLTTLLLATVVSFFLIVVAGIAPPWNEFGSAPPESPEAAARKVAALREKLEQPITVEQGFGPSMALFDALDFLSDRYQFTYLIDHDAFEASGVAKVEEQPVWSQKLVNVKLGTVLKILLARIKGDEDRGTFVVLPDYVLITTTAAERFRENLTPLRRGRVPTVSVHFDRRPIGAALRELAVAHGLNIVLDNRQEQLLQKPVTADFQQVPLDTVVRLLTDMADLRTVPIDNTLYVTSPDNARALQAEQDKVKAQEAQMLREQAAQPVKD